jgi:hypothetical protein
VEIASVFAGIAQSNFRNPRLNQRKTAERSCRVFGSFFVENRTFCEIMEKTLDFRGDSGI